MNVMAHIRRVFTGGAALVLGFSMVGCVDNGVSVKNTPPEVVFSKPSDGQIFREREEVFLSATVLDKEDPMANLTIQWEFSPDGNLQGEQTINGDQVNLNLGEFLDPGEYTITLTALDPRGDNGSDTVTFTVKPNEPPTAALLVPEENEQVVFGGAARVLLQVEDPDEHDLNDLELQWGGAAALGHPPAQPNSDGSAEFYLLDLDLGLYSLDVTVIDGLGATASDSVVFEVVYGDKDNDGFIDVDLGGDDCDDFNEDVNPSVDEICNGIDDDCDGEADESEAVDASTWYADTDSDSYGDLYTFQNACTKPSGYVLDSGDCDDTDAASFPGAAEYCDGHDDDCDGQIDEDDAIDVGTWYQDSDSDGHGNPAISQLNCYQPTGYVAVNTDCDDLDSDTYPLADEYCDGHDDDCDGQIDEDTAVDVATWYEDGDSDGYGNASVADIDCDQPSGYVSDNTDCDDAEASTNPGADEYCDGHDDDCDGSTDEDSSVDASTWYADTDSDGFGDVSVTDIECYEPTGYVANDSDCDDSDGDTYPGADEYCDGHDDDCDGVTDENSAVDASTWYADTDSDGYGDVSSTDVECYQPSGYVSDDTDCDDGESTTNPGADEYCDGHDDDCDGSTDEDSAVDASAWYADTDSDGYGDASSTDVECYQPSGYVSDDTDCDDGEASTNPGADEYCDGHDDDCDGSTDENSAIDASTWYADTDSDGYGDASSTDVECYQPSGYVSDDTDCDDGESTTNPGADEYCDGHDDDCDGSTDEDSAVDASTWYADTDSDGYGDASSTDVECYQPSGYVSDDTDCDDGESTTNPGADEYCDGHDDDCDGVTDEDSAVDASTWYADTDSDGYGDSSSTDVECYQPSGYVSDDTDCDDGESTTNPGADEYCDGHDDDCDGSIDEDSAVDASTWYADTDSDAFGDPAVSQPSCSQPSGHVADSTDCDDLDSDTYPGADEYCDGHDDDCDGSIDEDSSVDAITWYADVDSDGYGDASSTDVECYQPTGYVSDDTDCNDTKSAVNPAAPEMCDGIDNNCDGSTDGSDSLDASLWYTDGDSDGYGDVNAGAYACSQPSGSVADGTDCDDSSSAVNPSATEKCDGIDNNCDGSTDGSDSSDASTWYADNDSDGFGDGSNILKACSQPSSYLSDSSDCDDSSALAAPGLTEVCADGLDNDCDGTANNCELNGTIGLASADGKHTGEAAYDYSGYMVAGVGDINGDGLDDVMSGAWLEDSGGNAAGSAYLVFGSSATSSSLASADGKFSGEVAQDRAGSALGPAGDVNADGYDDLLVGAYGQDLGSNSTSNAGAAYLLLGPVSGSKSLSDVADVKLEGETEDDQFGLSVNTSGDLDGDGYDDFIVGAPYYCASSTGNGPGRAYVFYGDVSFASTIAAVDADAIIEGESNADLAGGRVSTAGDWDGDGFDDLLIGAEGDDDGGSNSGAAYVVLGPASGSISLSSADVKMVGENSNDKAGFSLDDAGDMNGDGYSDVIIGAYQDDTVASNAGIAHIVFGGGSTSTIDLSVSDVKLYGESKNDTAGYTVAGIGDIEGDGDPEVMVGAPNPGSKAGWTYLIYGPISEDLDLVEAGAVFVGETSNSFVGRSIDGAGDVDGDGYRDILLASSGDDIGAKDAGAFHIVLGMSGL